MPLSPSLDMGKDPFSQKETDVNNHLIACNYYLLQVRADISGSHQALSWSELNPQGRLGLTQLLLSGPVGQTHLNPLGFR